MIIMRQLVLGNLLRQVKELYSHDNPVPVQIHQERLRDLFSRDNLFVGKGDISRAESAVNFKFRSKNHDHHLAFTLTGRNHSSGACLVKRWRDDHHNTPSILQCPRVFHPARMLIRCANKLSLGEQILKVGPGDSSLFHASFRMK